MQQIMPENKLTNYAINYASRENCVNIRKDKDFFNHNGISPKRILKALYNNTFNNTIHGASTITQQYVKNEKVKHNPLIFINSSFFLL